MAYDVIIGLEVHVQLQTRTKIFCGCSTAFSPDKPNTQTCPVCLGLPGTLPVLNREAFQLAVRTALGLRCEIAQFTKWDRKQYFYPDLPKGYQISQYDLPFSSNGYLDVPQAAGESGGEPRRVRILRAHLEEDAGKNIHDESGRGKDSQVDLNRAGTPLVEIVTHPDLRSAEEARRWLEELRLLLVYLGVSDCNMQEGSLRCDANVNLHVHGPNGEKIPTPIVEIKNLNSFRFTEQAIGHEVERQWELYQRTGLRMGQAPKETRGFDPATGMTTVQRSKEEAADYRYFPDPDLVPVTLTPGEIETVRAALPERPADRRVRLQEAWQLSPYDAAVMLDQGRAYVDYYETVAGGCRDGKQAANWLTQDVQRELNERKIAIDQFPITADTLASLLGRVGQKQLTTQSARDVFKALLRKADDGGEVGVAAIDALVGELGLGGGQDEGALKSAIAEIVAGSPKVVADYRAGKQAAAGSLMGQVMKRVKGADPQVVRQMIVQEIESLPI